LAACASAFVLYGLFFYVSQQRLLQNITAAKLTTARVYADSVGANEAQRQHARAASMTATIAKLTASQLENSQSFGLLKDGMASTLEPFLDYSEIAAIEVTDKGNRPYASIWRHEGRPEFRVEYSMPPAFREQHKAVVRKPAIANGETQGYIAVYIDDQANARQTAAMTADLRRAAESEIEMLRDNFHRTLLPQMLVLLGGVTFVVFLGRAIARYGITETRRQELAAFNQTLEERVQERTQELEASARENRQINLELRASQNELLLTIDALRRKDDDLHHLAFRDALTGLANRALLLDRIQQSIALAARQHERRGVIFVDLDQFKAVNDSLGHDAGDALLKEAARRLTNALRQSDTVARVGGDEFVVVLNDDVSADDCAAVAQNLIESLAVPMELCGTVAPLGASLGIACFPEHADSPNELLKCADMAMYEAKSAGRGHFRFFEAAMASASAQRMQLESDLRRAIAEGELQLFYQPKISLRTQLLSGVEALVRWRHPVRGLVPPMEFIPLAEASGLIEPLGNWVLEEACRQSAAWRAQGLGAIKIAVNISACQMQRDGFVDHFLTLTRKFGIPPSDLEVELTESVIMADAGESARVFSALRRIGVVIAMDDFGTGYSSLSHLRQLPIDVLKIDRSFVMNADQDESAAKIVKMIIGLAQTLNLDVVAEGVETEQQADFLRACGCSIAQGYLYARPQPAAQFEQWIGARTRDLEVPPSGRVLPGIVETSLIGLAGTPVAADDRTRVAAGSGAA
jgi:diguanylate cyclase (GGDEF)-like protein